MDRPTKTKPALWSATDGAVLVEAALVLPLLLAFIFGVEEFGRLFLAQSALQHATYVAARCGAVNLTASTYCTNSSGANTVSSINAYASTQLWGLLNSSAVTFNTTIQTCPTTPGLSSATVTVRASYPFQFIVNLGKLLPPYTSTASPTLGASATYNLQC